MGCIYISSDIFTIQNFTNNKKNLNEFRGNAFYLKDLFFNLNFKACSKKKKSISYERRMMFVVDWTDGKKKSKCKYVFVQPAVDMQKMFNSFFLCENRQIIFLTFFLFDKICRVLKNRTNLKKNRLEKNLSSWNFVMLWIIVFKTTNAKTKREINI